MRKLLLTGHVVVSTGLIGADLVLLALGIAGATGADPLTVYPAADLVASSVVAPLLVAALVTGLVQVARSGWSLLRQWWLTIKLAATVVFTGIVLVVLVPRLDASAAAAAAGAPFGAAERMPLALVPAIAVTVLVVLTGLAITKPQREIRARRPAATGRR